MVSDRLLTNKKMTQRKAKEIRREEILATALRLFAEKGYNATSMRDLAGAVGLTEGALYKHFAGKQELFEASIERVIGMRDQVMTQALQFEIQDIRSVLVFLGTAVLRFLSEGEGQYVFRVFVQDSHQITSTDGVSVRERFAQGLTILMQVFDSAQRQGIIRSDINCEYAARQFGGTLMAAVVMQRIVGLDSIRPLDYDDFVGHFVDNFLRGALTDIASNDAKRESVC